MPNPDKYRTGFGLRKGLVLAGYKMTDIQVDHVMIQRYRTYQYPTRIVFTPLTSDAKEQELIDALDELISGDRTILSGYKNPYQCNMTSIAPLTGEVQADGSVIINLTGQCDRTYD